LACDWNGTLVDDVTRAWRAARTVLAARGLPAPDLPEFIAAFRLPLAEFFSGCGVEEGDHGAAEAEWNACVGAEKALPMPGAQAMLEAMEEAGVVVGVVSAAEEGVVEGEIDGLGLGGRFAFVVGSASPKRLAISRVVEEHGGGVAYLGDTEHDVTEALAAGALPIGFGSGYRPAEALVSAGAWGMVTDLRELPALLRADGRDGFLGSGHHTGGGPTGT